jgi:hypothetical protein
MSNKKPSTEPSTMERNKIIHLFLNLFNLNGFGLDRIYMGSYKLGFLKLALLFLSVAMLFLPNPLFGVFLLFMWVIWYYVDLFLVLLNALSKKKESPYGDGYYFKEDTIEGGFYVAIIILLFAFVVNPIVAARQSSAWWQAEDILDLTNTEKKTFKRRLKESLKIK